MIRTIFRSIVYVLNFISAFSAVANMSSTFYRGAEMYLPSFMILYPYFWITIFVCSLAALVLSAWFDKNPGKVINFLIKIDYSFFAVFTATITMLTASEIYYNQTQINMLLMPIAVHGATVLLLLTTVAHIRDKSFSRSLYWIDFVKKYPMRTPVGALMLLLAVVNLWNIFIINFLTSINLNDWSVFFKTLTSINPLYVSGSLFTLGVLTYFCKYLTSLSVQYEKANEDKIRAERFKTELITNVSHDIRTPLTSIINYVDLVKRLEIKDDKLTEYTAILDKKSTRLKVLINDLMEASRAGTGNIKVNLETINLAEIVGQIAGEFDTPFADNSLTYVMNPLPSEVAVLADGSHLWRVMENIFGNAVKYSMPDTRVYAGIKTDDDTVTFALKNVSQQPLNISADELMERFVRGDRSRHTDGNGLGLYIARNLTGLMGGEFVIAISGDLFEVTLKLKKTAHSLE